MFEQKQLQNLNEYFLELKQRSQNTIYFYRINGYNDEIKAFIQRYYESAKQSGVVVEGKIPNPNESNLSYYSEIMGMQFQLSVGFISSSLKKWLPRMNDYQRNNVSISIYDTLDSMRRDGKTENILKNVYIKFMCWLYYKFERIVNQLGNNQIPKILYEGKISNYELKFFTVLSNAGCDIVLLQYHGDNDYLAIDKESKYSNAYTINGSFPENFSVKQLRAEIEKQHRTRQIYGSPPKTTNCTNVWIEGNGLSDILKPVSSRGSDNNLYYNCFYRINGVEDKLTYLNELYQFYLQLKNMKRNVVILNNVLSKPTTDEIAKIKRKNYIDFEQMASDLTNNIQHTSNNEIHKLLQKSFLDILVCENEKNPANLNKIMSRAIYMLCWLKRYQSQLFQSGNPSDISCFIYLGGCRDENEACFIKMLARMPIDVLILVPNLNKKCCLEDRSLYELNYPTSMEVQNFPCDNSKIQIGTAAYHAERELDTLLYQDSGMYRNQQCSKAKTIVLKTIYEEIEILWDQEVKYRPNFSVIDNTVNIPAIFTKVSGVKDGMVQKYWQDIKKLITEDTFVIKKPPFITPMDSNPIKQYQTEFIKNRKIERNKIKSHKVYQYKMLREPMQDHLLDKLQLLLNQNNIKGTFENGTEYTIISTALNLNKELIRMIQKFDFTKKNPKLIYINTSETLISLEDTILTAFLSLIGFDIVFFVPTGYQTVENYFRKDIIVEEHQIGEYVYDLSPQSLDSVSLIGNPLWRKKIFKRGN